MTILGLLSRYSPISDRHAIAFASKLGYEKLKLHGINSVGYVKIAFTIFLLSTFLSILLLS